MKTFRVFIDEEEVLTYDDFERQLAITKMIADSNNLNTRKKDNVKPITLPGSGVNRRLLKFADDINAVVETAAKPKVRIEADGHLMFIGFCRISIATINNDLDVPDFEVICYGGNAGWIAAMDGKYLSDLDFTDQNHTRSYSVVNTSETVTSGREYVYDLIDRGKFSGQLDSNNRETVSINDRYPALSFTSLWDRTWAYIGYRCISSFRNTSAFTKLYYAFVNEYMRHTADKNDLYRMSCYSTELRRPTTLPAIVQMTFGNTQFVAPYYNNGGNMNNMTQGRYLCLGGRGKHTFTFRVDYRSTGNVYVSNVSANGQVYVYTANVIATFKKINRYKNNTPVVCSYDSSYVDELPQNTNGDNWYTLRTIEFTKTFELEWGDEVFVEVEMNQYRDGVPLQATNIGTATNRGPCDIYYSELSCDKIEGVLEMGENQDVDWSVNMPDDVLMLDFIKGCRDLFNLHIVADEDARTVYIEPFDDFYSQTPEDWTSKLNKAKDIQIEFGSEALPLQNNYKYKEDSNDKFVQEYNKQNTTAYGSKEVLIDNINAKNETEEMENSLFAATWMNTGERFGLSTTMLPRMWSDITLPPKTSKFMSRVLYYRGVKNLPSGESWRFNNVGTYDYQIANPSNTYRTTWPEFIFYDNKANNDFNLMYGDNDYSYGLYNKWWRTSHKIKSDGRKYIAYVDLTDNDFMNINFRKKKYIERDENGSYFILEKVADYRANDLVSTKCIFIKASAQPTLPKLNYLSLTFTPVVLTGPRISSTFSVSEDGAKIMVAGETIMERNRSGVFESASAEMYTQVNGSYLPVYTIVDNNIEKITT